MPAIKYLCLWITVQCDAVTKMRTYDGHAHIWADLLELLSKVPECVLPHSPLRGKARDGPFLHNKKNCWWIVSISDANTRCWSQILICLHHESQILFQQQQKRRRKNLSCLILFCSHKFHQIGNYFIFEQIQEKFVPILTKNRLFLPTNCY
jgi:hypothetical protein